MSSVTFVYPFVLGLLLGLPGLVAFLVWAERRRSQRLARLGDSALVARLLAPVSAGRRWWQNGLWLACVGALVVALARPTWGVRTDIVDVQGVSVFVLLDVSESMNAEDIAPSRLARAKIGVQDLFESLGGNEAGLIVFAGDAFVFFPLTTDMRSAQSFLSYVDSDVLTRQGTAVGDAIDLALTAFDERQATEKVIVLLSDGEDHATETDAAIRRAAEAGVPVHVIGYGTESGGSIPIRNSSGAVVGNKLNRAGEIVVTTLEEQLLREIAEETDGFYQRIDPSGSAIEQVARLINQADGGDLDTDERTVGIERYALFGLLALVLLSLEILLPEVKSG